MERPCRGNSVTCSLRGTAQTQASLNRWVHASSISIPSYLVRWVHPSLWYLGTATYSLSGKCKELKYEILILEALGLALSECTSFRASNPCRCGTKPIPRNRQPRPEPQRGEHDRSASLSALANNRKERRRSTPDSPNRAFSNLNISGQAQWRAASHLDYKYLLLSNSPILYHRLNTAHLATMDQPFLQYGVEQPSRLPRTENVVLPSESFLRAPGSKERASVHVSGTRNVSMG